MYEQTVSENLTTKRVDRFQESLNRAYDFLFSSLNEHHGFQGAWQADRWVYDESVSQYENFTSALIANLLMPFKQAEPILESLAKLLQSQQIEGFTNFFQGVSPLPLDLHTTCLSLEFLYERNMLNETTIHQALDRILKNTTKDGVIALYFTNQDSALAEVTDPVACIHLLHLLHHLERSDSAEKTFEFVESDLIQRGYLNGTRYYPAALSYLFFLSRFVGEYPFLSLQWALELKRAAHEGFNPQKTSSLDLAMQAYIELQLGMNPLASLAGLVNLQDPKGYWEKIPLLEDGQKRPLLGSRQLTTAFAICALESFKAGQLD